ncbi:hypothetical protein C8J56DRAFT_1062300 [Mycena floridula]|nr:hypothetical protein C8J56DRAFT_1062300 [Mycena floridula]
MEKWKQYLRGFDTIANWLIEHEKIQERQRDIYFWYGLPKEVAQDVKSQYRAINPNWDTVDPVPTDIARNLAEANFKRGCFDENMFGMNSPFNSESDSNDTEEEKIDKFHRKQMHKRYKKRHYNKSDSEDSDSDEEEEENRLVNQIKKQLDQRDQEIRDRLHMKGHQHHQTPQKHEDKPANILGKKKSESTPTTPKGDNKADTEVKDLTDKMSKMTVTEPKYAMCYFQISQLNPEVAGWYPKPQPRLEGSIAPSPRMDSSRTMRNAVNNYTGTGSNAVPLGPRRSAYVQTAGMSYELGADTNPMRGKCYGCGDTNHGLRDCPPIIDALNSGVMGKLPDGRYTGPDGQLLRRFGTDTFMSILDRMKGSDKQEAVPAAPTVQAKSYLTHASAFFEPESEEYDTMEESDDESYDHEGITARVMEAARTARKTPIHGVKKKIFDGVLMPPRKEATSQKAKDNDFRPKGKEILTRKDATNKENTNPRPIEARPARQVEINEDIEMVDIPIKADSLPKIVECKNDTEKMSKNKRISELAQQVNIESICDKILDVKVDLTVKEVLGLNKEVAGRMGDQLKNKAINPDTPLAARVNFGRVDYSRHDLVLIEVKIGKFTTEAFIDSGSEINIISKEMYHKCKDDRGSVSPVSLELTEVGGSKKELRKYLKYVKVKCGGVVDTEGDFYVANFDVDFTVLLGRPFQVKNKLCLIETEKDGTCVELHPNKNNYNAVYRMPAISA